MANLEALLKSEAKSEIDAIISEAKERASEIIANAKEEVATFANQRERSAESQHEATLVRGKSSAQLEASSLKLRAQHELVESAFVKAQQEIDKIIKDKVHYKGIMEKLFNEVLATIQERDLAGADLKTVIDTVTVNSKDKVLIGELLSLHHIVDAHVQTDDAVVGGLKIHIKGANVVIANTLPARLEAARDELAASVSKALFASG